MYTIYSVSIVLFFAILSPYFLYQALRYRKYVRNLPQRLGYLPLSFNFDGDDSIWIQAVSVGEVLTVRALLPELRQRYPRLRIFLSTTTLTGHHVASTRVHDVDGVFYFPLDLTFVIRRTLAVRSEEHTSELQSRQYLVCRLLLEKKNKTENSIRTPKKKTNRLKRY